MFKRILIANRGEIACRIIRTARKMGIESVAIYSEADANSPHVLQADTAFCIGAAPSKDSYLHIPAIIKAALQSKAEAIHPGFGFLSENPQFAQACEDVGIIFVGPSVQALQTMGSKQVAKQLLENTRVPLTPGYHGLDQSESQLLLEAEKIGFPVLLKAANGGGGKGMRAVHAKQDFQAALQSAKREALASFGDQTIIIEKLINNPRHVEIQIVADNQGNIVHLFERDCSIQRRHQKIIEEAPAPYLSDTLKEQLYQAACEVARTIAYTNAGTIEFLVDASSETFYFMEMNTRLQVEHPVTEMITGLDLVALQLKIAAGQALPFTQSDIHVSGHALECRIYAEDPDNHFLPSIGTIAFLQEPTGDGIRIDSGVQQQTTITQFYDPMIAKLISWGNHREEALQRMQQALAHYAIGGIKTNIPFLQAICRDKAFEKGAVNTHFLEEHPLVLQYPDTNQALHWAVAYDYLLSMQRDKDPLVQDTLGFQLQGQRTWIWRYVIQNQIYEARILFINKNTCEVTIDNQSQLLSARLDNHTLTLQNTGESTKTLVQTKQDAITFYTKKGAITVYRHTFESPKNQALDKNQLTAPMPATIVAILKNTGDAVKAGEGLMVLEAMKMEHTIHAPSDGTLKAIFYEVGAKVLEGAQLLALDA